jgi:hypothetical protein
VQKELGGPPPAGSSMGEAAPAPTPVFLSLTLSETSPHVQRLAEPEDWCVPRARASAVALSTTRASRLLLCWCRGGIMVMRVLDVRAHWSRWRPSRAIDSSPAV